MTTIAISTEELKDLIKSAVDEAIERRFASILDEIEEEEVVDRNLARLMDEARNEPTISGEEFLAELKASL